MVVSEYEAGTSIKSLQKKYGIGGVMTIPTWIDRYGKPGTRAKLVRIQTAAEADRVSELEQQVENLEQALGKVTLEKLKLESIVEEMEAVYGEGWKKNAPPSSSGSSEKLPES
jgi:transposase